MRPHTTIKPPPIPCHKRTLLDQFFHRPATLRCLARLGNYAPRKREFFLQAFTHASFVHEHPDLNLRHYQRLEFLGDAVISLYAADKLFRLYPEMREGELSPLRSSLICQESLCQLGKFLSLDELILLGKGTVCSPALLGDVFEALVGSIYTDCGFPQTFEILEHLLSVFQKKTGKKFVPSLERKSF